MSEVARGQLEHDSIAIYDDSKRDSIKSDSDMKSGLRGLAAEVPKFADTPMNFERSTALRAMEDLIAAQTSVPNGDDSRYATAGYVPMTHAEMPDALTLAQDNYPIHDYTEEQFLNGLAPPWLSRHNSEGSDGAPQHFEEPMTGSDDEQVQAFAKLEFGDGTYYMNTWSVELGRNIDQAHEFERERESQRGTSSSSKRRSVSAVGLGMAHPDRTSPIGRDEDDHITEGRETIDVVPRKDDVKKIKRKNSNPSRPPSSHQDGTESHRVPIIKTDYQHLALRSIDPSRLHDFRPEPGPGPGMPMPPPDTLPLIPLNAPFPTELIKSGPKGISRKHAKIGFNFEERVFQIEFMGRNGGFLGPQFCEKDSVWTLASGSIIQIGGVSIRFVLPNVELGKTGAESESSESDSISESEESLPLEVNESIEFGSEDEEEEFEISEHGEENTLIKEEEQPQAVAAVKDSGEVNTPVPPKRKGPGRPPKNGIISQRAQAEREKEARKEAKAKSEGKSTAPPGRGTGKSSKQAQPAKTEESSRQPNGKRKYTKRKRAGDTTEPQATRESTEHTELMPPEELLAAQLNPKPPKKEKPIKPPRSPSPVFDEASLTPEQLARPTLSYVIMINEALTNSKTGQMSLPQIYRAIERRHPYFKLRAQTQGWQSSVRHNLSQHPAFKKIERDGKGWMWGLEPDIPIEKDKKRRVTPPPMTNQYPYHPNAMVHHPYPYPNPQVPNRSGPPQPYGMHPGLPPNRMPYPPPPRTGLPLPLINTQSESTYRSPYQSTPPPAAAPSNAQGEKHATADGANGTNGHYPNHESQLHHSQPHRYPGAQAVNVNPSFKPPPATSPGQPSVNNNNHDINQVVNKFKAALINTLDDKTRAESLVTSAINRVLGSQTESILPGEPEPNEKTIMNTFSRMLESVKEKNATLQGSSVFTPLPEVDKGKVAQASTSTELAAENAAKLALTNGMSATASRSPESKETAGLNGAVVQSTENNASGEHAASKPA